MTPPVFTVQGVVVTPEQVAAGLCPHFEDHTAAPAGYLQWHAWATKMSKTHQQRKCDGCGRYSVWEPKCERKAGRVRVAKGKGRGMWEVSPDPAAFRIERKEG